MDHPAPQRDPAAPQGRRRAPVSPGILRLLSNHNPFYALSAVLVLAGLRMSFDPTARAFPAWAFLLGLAAYTVLLAGTACVLVRLGDVWDDVRTLLLLVVVVLFAIAMIFDDVLMRDRRLGQLCDLGAAAFAIALSEVTLRGMRLRLPALYRLPFYLGLALAFGYPAALAPLLERPGDPALPWGLLGFSAAAGLATLTLLPAIRRGPGYSAKCGAPWRWPFYPWALFVVLGAGLAARAASLCWSLQAPGFPEIRQSIFRPYFLVPLGLGVAAVVLELGLVARSRAARRVGLALPAGLVALAMLGHGPGSGTVSGRFLAAFVSALGSGPAYLTLLVAGVFYGVATARRVPSAAAWLTAALAALSAVGPRTLGPGDLALRHAWPLAAAAAVQAALALRSPASRRLALAAGLGAAATAVATTTRWGPALGAAAGAHVLIAAALMLGAAFHDGFARWLRMAGLAALALAGAAALVAGPALAAGPARDVAQVYPLGAAAVAGAYGWWLGDRRALASAAAGVAAWLAVAGGRVYAGLRPRVAGLDQIALGLACFAVAALISLSKAGVLLRWTGRLRGQARRPPA
jgi:hypothetical protein